MFLNTSDVIGNIINAGTQNMTGDIVTSVYLIIIFLVAVCIMFGIPLEFMAVIILPLCLSIAAYYSDFMTPIVIIIVYVSALISKHFLFR